MGDWWIDIEKTAGLGEVATEFLTRLEAGQMFEQELPILVDRLLEVRAADVSADHRMKDERGARDRAV